MAWLPEPDRPLEQHRGPRLGGMFSAPTPTPSRQPSAIQQTWHPSCFVIFSLSSMHSKMGGDHVSISTCSTCPAHRCGCMQHCSSDCSSVQVRGVKSAVDSAAARAVTRHCRVLQYTAPGDRVLCLANTELGNSIKSTAQP